MYGYGYSLDTVLKGPYSVMEYRNSKTSPHLVTCFAPQSVSSFTEFNQKHNKDSLWMENNQAPSWVQEELAKYKVNDDQLLTKSRKKKLQERSLILKSIKTCIQQKNLNQARKIHSNLFERGLLENDVYISTAVISMYAKCGAPDKAREIFDELTVRNDVSWNAVISGYAQHGHGYEALKIFKRMKDEGFIPNAVTFVSVLKACGSVGLLEKGEEIHAEIHKLGLLKNDVVLGNTLLGMYTKCGALAKAEKVFEELPERTAISWTVLIDGYAECGFGDKALELYDVMKRKGFPPHPATFVCALKACANVRSAKKGKEVHSEIRKAGLSPKNHVLGSALVAMYSKCGEVEKAWEVFNELSVRDVVSWTSLIGGYVDYGRGHEALKCFREMREDGVSPNVVTFSFIVKACCSVGSPGIGEEVYIEANRQGLLRNDIVLGTALIDMFVKFGMLEKAREVFDKLQRHDVVAWTALIAGYVQQGINDKAMDCYSKMRDEGLSPDGIILSSICKACGTLGLADKAGEVHADIREHASLEDDIALGNALVNMYAKCGRLSEAQEVFNQLPNRDVITWNSLIYGYAQFGQVTNVFQAYEQMKADGMSADELTFCIILTACSHAGLLGEGQMFFNSMYYFNLIPTLEHYTCMIDLFSRAGDFNSAIALIENVPPSDCVPLWTAVLGACRKWGNLDLAEWVFEHLVKLDEDCASAYISMSNIYVYGDASIYD